MGGPIAKNKTFFFSSYEGLRLRQPTSRESDVPSLTARDSAPTSIKPFFQAYPLPNGPDEANGLARATYEFADPSTLNASSIRIDHHVSQLLNLFVRYAHSSSDREQRGAAPNSLSTVTNADFGLQTFTAGLTYFITPHLLADFRFNWGASSATGEDHLDSFGGAIPLSAGAVLPFPFNERNSLFQFAPAVGPPNIQLTFGKNNSSLQHQINVLGNSSWQFCAHVLKIGLDFRGLSPNLTPAAYDQTNVFSDIRSSLMSTTLFSAVATTVSVQSHFTNYSAYVQDSWRPSARLSLTYGMRWEYNPAVAARASNGLSPSAIQGLDNLRTLSLAQPGIPLYRASRNNYAPRAGAAYLVRDSLSWGTVIRAGAGIFYDLGNGSVGTAVDGVSSPFLAQKILFGVPFPLSRENESPPSPSAAGPFNKVQAFASNLDLPFTYQWNASVAQSLGIDQALTVTYVGSAGHRLLRNEEYIGGSAGVPAAFTQVLFTSNAGVSSYTALQVQFQRRSKRGPHVIASYTLAHSLDNVSTDASFDGVPARFLNIRSDYGPSDFDIRHTGTLALDYKSLLHTDSQLLKALLSNWSIDAIAIVRSSEPVDVVVSRDIGFGVYALRPDLIKGIPLYIDDPALPGGRRINSAALSVPSDNRQGNLSRNLFVGFPLIQADAAFGRRIRISRQFTVLTRADVFNVLNHPNFAAPVGQFGRVDAKSRFLPQEGFGVSQSMLSQGLQTGPFNTGFSPLYQIGNGRSVQIALKVEF